MFWLYNLLFLLLSPIWLPMLWWKNKKRPDKVDWKHRQGAFPIQPRSDRKRIWFHAVSVGEVIAAKPILERLRKLIPDFEIVLTCTTGAGHKTATEQLSGIVDQVFFFPIDIARFMFVAIQRVQPSVVVVMETELWMNFLSMAKQFGATTMLVNGRISDRSFERSKVIRPLMKAIVRKLDFALMQTQIDRDRITEYGARSAEIFGNSKFDQAIEVGDKTRDDWRRELEIQDDEFLVIVGSTRSEEEENFVFEALESIRSEKLRVVYAPRHMDRVDAVAERAAKTFKVGFRSKSETSQFIILDTYGELASLYSAGQVAIIGGGFANHGGQNLIQALAQGTPVIHGPHMQNFAAVAKEADNNGAAIEVHASEELANAIESIRNDMLRQTSMSNSARLLIAENLGASDRYAQAVAAAAKTFQSEHADWLAKRKPVNSNS